MPDRQAGVPETAAATVRRYCDAKIPLQHLDKMRVECAVRGKNITIYECRPPWDPDLGSDWTRQAVAQLRYDPTDHRWRLYWADRNGRWHAYEPSEATSQLDVLISEIDDDPTGIFWG